MCLTSLVDRRVVALKNLEGGSAGKRAARAAKKAGVVKSAEERDNEAGGNRKFWRRLWWTNG